MELEFHHYAIAIVGSAFAGCINTLAGNGSAITLTILTEVLGLPPTIANGTNRVGIMAQTTFGSYEFIRGGKVHFKRNLRYIVPVLIGGVGGALVAANVSNEQFRSVFKFLMVGLLFVILIKPKNWLQETDLEKQLSIWIVIPVFLGIGFYAGFIQMGMGIVFLAVMVLLSKVNITESNAVKTVVVGLLTIFALAIFQSKGLIDWRIGGIMAIGQATGGWATARYASQYKQADTIAYWFLIIIVVGAVVRLFFAK